MKHEPKLGYLITDEQERDAVHIAIAPVTAGQRLECGDRVTIENGLAYLSHDSIGIVDPFLEDPVNEGERFWLCLYPGSVTSLRHSWTSPAFPPKALTDYLKRKENHER